jgi:hypothetical protein
MLTNIHATRGRPFHFVTLLIDGALIDERTLSVRCAKQRWPRPQKQASPRVSLRKMLILTILNSNINKNNKKNDEEVKKETNP